MGYTWRYGGNLWNAGKGNLWDALGSVEGIFGIQVKGTSRVQVNLWDILGCVRGIFGMQVEEIFGIQMKRIPGMHWAVWRESLGFRWRESLGCRWDVRRGSLGCR